MTSNISPSLLALYAATAALLLLLLLLLLDSAIVWGK
jgi:hypothetical protein